MVTEEEILKKPVTTFTSAGDMKEPFAKKREAKASSEGKESGSTVDCMREPTVTAKGIPIVSRRNLLGNGWKTEQKKRKDYQQKEKDSRQPHHQAKHRTGSTKANSVVLSGSESDSEEEKNDPPSVPTGVSATKPVYEESIKWSKVLSKFREDRTRGNQMESDRASSLTSHRTILQNGPRIRLRCSKPSNLNESPHFNVAIASLTHW